MTTDASCMGTATKSKLTMYRRMAADAIDEALQVGTFIPRKYQTRRLATVGGQPQGLRLETRFFGRPILTASVRRPRE